MSVFIAADSRGSHGTQGHVWAPTNNSWTTQFMNRHQEHSFVSRRAGIDMAVHHLYDCDPFLRQYDDKFFDLAFIHTGMNTGIDYWTPPLFKALFRKHYTPEGLKHQNGEKYVYIHEENEKKIFQLLEQKCKRVIHVGLQIVTRWHLELRQDQKYIPTASQMAADPEKFKKSLTKEWTPTYNELAEHQNKRYAAMCNDHISLPWDEQWVDECCPEDFLHFNEKGINWILDKVESYLK